MSLIITGVIKFYPSSGKEDILCSIPDPRIGIFTALQNADSMIRAEIRKLEFEDLGKISEVTISMVKKD